MRVVGHGWSGTARWYVNIASDNPEEAAHMKAHSASAAVKMKGSPRRNATTKGGSHEVNLVFSADAVRQHYNARSSDGIARKVFAEFKRKLPAMK